MVVLVAKMCAPVGGMEREGNFSRFARERERVTFQGLLCSPLKSGGFLWQFCGTFVCTSKGYVERETSLASLERERVAFQGSLCSPLKSDGFLWHFCCTSRGYVGREERESHFTGLAMLASQK